MAAWSPRTNEIFAAALEVPGAKRQAFVKQACGADVELHRQVEAMLSAHAQAGSFLDQPVAGEVLMTTATAAPSSGPPLPATGSVVQALAGPAVDLPGRYQMEEEIARGGMGTVLRGRDTELKREIAVKVLLETHAGRTEFVQRFVEEAQIAGQLQHPGITPVYDVGTAAGKRPYFTMKLVKGQTLAALLGARGDKRPACPPGAGQQHTSEPLVATDRLRFFKIFEAVCQTLAYAHAHDVIHRDLKPANVMVGAFGEVQVMDWGLAKVLSSRDRERAEEEAGTVIATVRTGEADSGQTHAGTAMGTPAYMAPEQARGEVERVDERADVFGLGALLCEILTGQPPFPGKTSEAMRRAQKADLSGALSRLDACGADGELIALAKHCLAAEPEDRPRHAGAVAERMTAYLESVEARLRKAELERAQAQVKTAEERKRHKLTLALAGSVLLTVLLVGSGYGWLWRQREAKRAETARRVDEALEKAAVLRGKAVSAAVGDLSGWVEAEAEIRRAEDLLDRGDTDEALRERVAAVRDELVSGRGDAQRRADDAAAERRLVARLETIRAERSERPKPEEIDRAYADAFRVFGLDLDVVDPEEAGARLAGRPATAEIAAALDEWSLFRRRLLADGKPVRPWPRLVQAAARADPDPWRNHLRKLFGRSGPLVAATLVKQADDTTSLERQPAASLVLLAILLRSAGDRERSLAVLRGAWQRFPSDFWVNFLLGGVSWTPGENKPPDESVRFLTAAIAARPYSPVALACLGIALNNQGKIDEAIACHRQAIQLDPSDALVHNMLGVALRKQGKSDEAIACFRQAIKLDPKCGTAFTNLAKVLAGQGKLHEAISYLRQAIRHDPKNAQAHSGLGTILLSRFHDHEGAIAAFRHVVKLEPKNATAHYDLGWALNSHGKLRDAIAAFRQAIQLDPKYAKAHDHLGFVLAKQGKWNEAIGFYRRAIQLDPKLAIAHLNLGMALAEQLAWDEAIASYRQAIQLDPKAVIAHHELGLALRQRNKLAEAVAAFRHAIKIDPKYSEAHLQLGLALGEQGLLDEAIASFEKVILLDPRNAWGPNNLGWGLHRKGKIDEAIASYRKAIALDPRNATAHNNLGWALHGTGKFQEAEEQYRKALEFDPKHARARANLANVRRLIAAEPKLAGLLKGEYEPADNEDRLTIAQVCTLKRLFLTAARLYAAAFAADPKLAGDPKARHRYNAACCAALAAAGKGADKLDDRQCVRWRRQALTWLRADLALYQKQAGGGKAADRALVSKRMQHWQKDSDLAGIRDRKALAMLPAVERQACEKLWADVEVLLRQAQAKAADK
jgi:serine/threonine-protein kinase